MPSRFPVYLAAAILAGALSPRARSDRSAPKEIVQSAALAPGNAASPSTNAAQELCRQLGESNLACLGNLEKEKQTVRFLTATVADPKGTNLGLYFDRSVEALIWAVGDVGYSFRSYWMPWPTEKQSDGAAPVVSGQPGFLLFRGTRPRDFLVVWLVGESPTGGIEKAALAAAMANTRLYDTKAAPQIVGPSFSGSFLSLGDAIEQDHGSGKISVVTGMATSLDAENDFVGRLGSKVDFGATVENSSLSFCRFIDYLHQERAGRNEIAILAEDQTVYGQQTQAIPCLNASASSREQWLLVRFPREIARLRNSSETPANTIAGTTGTPPPPSQALPFTLRSHLPEQSLPVFSEQSPLSQEAALLDLANALQQEHVRYAAIIATDVLDQIFLARFLHRACPDVRLIVFDADLLFVRAESANTLEGILNVSTYPLFLRNQHWTSQELNGQLPRRVPFASRAAEGTYNAARELLWEAGLRAPGELMLEYSDPHRPASRRPPLWLSVLGRTGYWPVALLPEDEKSPPANGQQIQSSLLKNPQLGRSNEILHPESPSHAWRLVVILVSLLSCFQCLYVWLVYDRQLAKTAMWTAKAPRLAAVFVYRILWTYPRIARGEFNRLLISMTLALAAAEAVFVASGVPYAISNAPDTGSPLFWFLILPSACLIALTITAIQLTRHAKARFTVAGEWVIFAAFLGLWGASLQWLRPDRMLGFFFAYRTVHPASGVSPGLPVLLLIAIWFLWGFFQLWRRAGVVPPAVPALDEPRLYAAKLNDWIPRPFPLGALPFLALLIFWTFVRLRSVENGWYDDLITLLVLVSYFLMFSVWCQLLFGWRYFRRFLEALERHAIREAFSKLPKELATLPLLNRGHQRPYMMATARCCDTLTAITNDDTIAQHGELKQVYEKRQVAIRTRVKGLLHLLSQERGADLFKARKIASIKTQLERSILHATNGLIDYARTQFWRSGSSDSLSAEEASAKREKQAPLDANNKLRILAEEIIALRFTMYIVYTIDQMKKLMWFVVIAFVLIVAALNIYPFESPRLIDLSSIAIFVAISIGTAMVLAQMDRDAILSRLTDTNPNQISRNFFLHVARFGALPLITVLSTEFPSIRNFLFSWIQPALQALGTSG